jgi:DNA-directed RNA polymerase specialized sigma24 family protein
MTGKKRIRRSKGTPPKDLYFGPNEQQAIKEFKHSVDHKEREEIYNKRIVPALNKLVENLIYIYGFAASTDNIPELKNDCVSFLYENLHKFDESRGTKAFSYFNVIARNWLIIHSRRRTRFTNKHVSLDDQESLSNKDKHTIASHSMVDSPDDIMIKSRQREEVRALLNMISLRLIEEHEKSCMQAILTIFEQLEEIDLLHKRAVFVYVRDISNLNSKQLSSAMSVIRRHYKDLVKNGHGVL